MNLFKALVRNIIISIFKENPEIINNIKLNKKLKFRKLFKTSISPTKESEEAAGYDIYAHSYLDENKETVFLQNNECIIKPFSHCLIKVGISVISPENCYCRVAARSGLALKYGIMIGAGVVDKDYSGEVGVVMFNCNKEPFHVKKGDRIAQIICECIEYPTIEEVTVINETSRGAKGFGSTGV